MRTRGTLTQIKNLAGQLALRGATLPLVCVRTILNIQLSFRDRFLVGHDVHVLQY